MLDPGEECDPPADDACPGLCFPIGDPKQCQCADGQAESSQTPGFTIQLDELVITDDHPNPPPAPVVLTPDQVLPGEFINDMLIQLTEQPLFADPDALFTLGPGFLIQDFNILDPFTATADVTVSTRAAQHGHGIKVETDDFIAAGCLHVDSESDPPVNSLPTVDFDCPSGLSVGEPFEVTFMVDDVDGDIVTIEAVVEDIATTEIITETAYIAYEVPQVVVFSFPALPAGQYELLGLSDDMLVPDGGSLCTCEFEVSEPKVPTVSEWGLIVMTLLSLTAGTIIFGRRRRPAAA